MDSIEQKLVDQIGSLARQLNESSKKDAGSIETRATRRELLKASRNLSNATRNEGQIVEDYLYSVSSGPGQSSGAILES